MKALWPELDSLAALETGRYWTPAKMPGEPLYRPAINNGYWAEDILTNGLVLYTPLWLYSGAKFPSVDIYKHTCIVSGATWGSQGRSFDGNDIITCPTIAVGAEAWTMGCWIKVASLPVSLYGLVGGASGYAGLLMTPTGISVGKLGVDPGVQVDYSVPLNTFLHIVAVVLNDSAASIYVNGIFTGTAARMEYWTLGNHIVNLGAAVNVADIPLTGTIGEATIYRRALTASEILHNYRATRWRYA